LRKYKYGASRGTITCSKSASCFCLPYFLGKVLCQALVDTVLNLAGGFLCVLQHPLFQPNDLLSCVAAWMDLCSDIENILNLLYADYKFFAKVI
jgi:hypothetical protein